MGLWTVVQNINGSTDYPLQVLVRFAHCGLSASIPQPMSGRLLINLAIARLKYSQPGFVSSRNQHKDINSSVALHY